MTLQPIPRWLPAAALVALGTSAATADTITIEPDRDNAIFDNGPTSSGAGTLFAGRTGSMGGGTIQRTLLRFDVAGSLPAGAVITSARLDMWVTGDSPFGGPAMFTIQRVLADWGEGTSVAGGGHGAPATPDDATWEHTFFPGAFWATTGGDFDAAVRASSVLSDTGPASWGPTADMLADVQSWQGTPADNDGWILRGDESSLLTARRFGSREFAQVAQRPKLVLEVEVASSCPEDVDGTGEVDFQDLLLVLAAWGDCPGCPEDIDSTGVVDFQDLLLLLAAWGPCR